MLEWTRCDYAGPLNEQNPEVDPPNANALLDEFLNMSSKLGMRPLMERVLIRRELLGRRKPQLFRSLRPSGGRIVIFG